LSVQGDFTAGVMSGVWTYWDIRGNKTEELKYEPDGSFKIINAWGTNGHNMVKNGTGTYQTYFENGKLAQEGNVKNGNKTGVWKTYHTNGNLKEEGEYKQNTYYITNTWAKEGAEQIKDGEGEYITYFENSEYPSEKGDVLNGLKDGYWETYHENSIVILQETNYQAGKLNGQSITYYRSGNLLTSGGFVNDKKEGEWVWYYENGQIQCSVNFVNDKKEGVQTFWSESGHPVKEEIYEHGELISEVLL